MKQYDLPHNALGDAPPAAGSTLLRVRHVRKSYTARSLGDMLRMRPAHVSPALRDVSFELQAAASPRCWVPMAPAKPP